MVQSNLVRARRSNDGLPERMAKRTVGQIDSCCYFVVYNKYFFSCMAISSYGIALSVLVWNEVFSVEGATPPPWLVVV